MKLHKLFVALLTVIGAIAGFASPAARADGAAPTPFIATYAVTFRGIDAGTLQMELRRQPGTNRYVYETRANPSLLARLVVSRNALERSVLEIDAHGVRPLEWKLDDGKGGRQDSGELHFDWQSRQVAGNVDGQAVALPAEPGLQDRMSIQIAVMTALLRGDQPGSIALIDDEEIKHYTYRRGGEEKVKTKLGELRAVIYESTRPGSSRVSKVWHSPAHEFIPVRAEQIRKGRAETVMVLTSVEYTDAAPRAP